MRVRAAMPGDPVVPARGAGWMLGAGVLLLLAAHYSYEVIVRSGVPNGYLGRHWDEARFGPWKYPTEDVRWVLAIIGLDLVFGVWLFARRSTTSLPVRAVLYCVLNFFGLVCLTPMMMHVGWPLSGLLGWLLFASAWGLLFALVAGILRGFRKPT